MSCFRSFVLFLFLLNTSFFAVGQIQQGDTALAWQHMEMATILADSAQYDSAAFYYGQAMAVYRQVVGSKPDSLHYLRLIKAMNELGHVWLRMRYLDTARKLVKEAYEIGIQQLGPHQEVANTLDRIGHSYFVAGQFDQAYPYFQQALEMRLQVLEESDLDIGKSYNNLATVFFKKSDYDQALGWFQKSLVIFDQLAEKSHDYLGALHNNMGNIYSEKRSYPQAIIHFRKALENWTVHFGSDHPQTANAYLALGTVYTKLGDYEQATLFLQHTRSIWKRKLGRDHPLLSHVYQVLGNIYSNKGELDFAVQYLDSAVLLTKKHLGNSDPGLAQTYSILGSVYKKKGDLLKAKSLFQQALQITYDRYGPRSLSAASISNKLGLFYTGIGEPDQAISFHQQSLRIYSYLMGQDHQLLTAPYLNLGNAFRKKGDFDRAISSYQKALNILLQHEIKDLSTAGCYLNLGIIYEEKKMYQRGIQHFRQALTLYQADDHVYGIGLACSNLSALYSEMGKVRESLKWNLQALTTYIPSLDTSNIYTVPTQSDLILDLQLLRYLKNRANELIRLYNLSSDIQAIEASIAYFELAMQLMDRLRHGYQFDASKEILQEKYFDIYYIYIGILEGLWQHQPDPALIEKAFYAFEKSKAVLMQEAMRTREAEQTTGIPDSLLLFKRHWVRQTKTYEQLIHAEQQLGKGSDSSKLSIWNSYVFEAQQRIDSLERILEQSYPLYRELKYDEDVRALDEVQAHLSSKTAVIEYFFGKNTIFCFVIQADTVSLHHIPLDSSLRKHIHHFIRRIENPDQLLKVRDSDMFHQFSKNSYHLYKQLLQPYLPDSTEQLILIPDGPLGYLPFEMLLTDSLSANSQSVNYTSLPYLIKRFPIRYEYSASLLLHQSSISDKASHLFAGFAPTYPMAPLSPSQDKISMRGLYEGMAWELDTLWHNQTEVSEIAKSIGGQTFIANKAIERHFKEKAIDYQVLHLAMHALLNDSLPQYSGLAFTQDGDRIDDGFLYVSEIYSLPLKAELVVLSACETGKGKLIRGEGIMSLARAFKYAGTPNIVMSLWQVNDRSTQELMDSFYRHLQAGLPKDRALQQAKLDLMANPAFAHPFYWAPFVLVGNDQPVDLSTLNGPFVWGLVVLLLFIAAIWLFRKRMNRELWRNNT